MPIKLFQKFLSLVILLSAPFFSPVKASEHKTVTWQIINWPPFMEESGGTVKGQYAELLKVLEKGLPDYRHKRSKMLWSRVWRLIETGSHVCNIFAFKNPKREKFTEFSDPFSMFLSNQIIMRRDTLDSLKIDQEKPFSLGKMVQVKDIKGILEKSRSYSAPLDALLKAHKGKSNFFRQPIRSEGLIKVLLYGRVDYILEYPAIVSYYRNRLPEKDGELVSVQIEEIAPVTYGYVACPKNVWGKELIGKINTLIRSLKPNKSYRQIIEMMATNQKDLEIIRKKYPDFIKDVK